MQITTGKMVSVMVDLFGNDLQDPNNFHHVTLKALSARGLVWVPANSPYSKKRDAETVGYVFLTSAGEKWLVENRHAIMADGNRISASTKQYRHEYIRTTLLAHHIRTALDLYNTDYVALTGKKGVGVVDDLSNNVGRRCNIRNNGDVENRCYEIIAQVVFYATPLIENQYLLHYVGVEKLGELSDDDYGPYVIASADTLTNLY